MVPLDPMARDKKVIISVKLSQEEEKELIKTISHNKDIFA
jgi:hypothetical protein